MSDSMMNPELVTNHKFPEITYTYSQSNIPLFPMATSDDESRGRKKRAHPHDEEVEEEEEEEEEEDTTSSGFDKALLKTLKKHEFVFVYCRSILLPRETLFRDNVIDIWRQHFVLTENMYEVYFPEDDELIHPEAEPVFTGLESYYRKGYVTKLPYAAAQVTYPRLRCEISPRNGLVNADNSTFGEIEHFMDSQDSSHPKYSQVSGLEFPVCSRDGQTTTLSQGIGNNQTLAYFVARVYLFLKHLGIDENRLQFRQLPPDEMAPDAADCWVVEIKCSTGWVSCAWIRCISDPCVCQKAVITPDKKELIRAFKKGVLQKKVREALKALSYEEAMKMKDTLQQKGHVYFEVKNLQKTVPLTKHMVSVSTETLTASVIKLTFYMGRIISGIYENSFYLGGDKENQQFVFRFTPLVAPIKCAISITDPNTKKLASSISEKLKAARIVHALDSGKSDELGIPFALVVDSTTSVTLRERDSNSQIRFAKPGMEEVDVEDVVDVLQNLTKGRYTWGEMVLSRRNR